MKSFKITQSITDRQDASLGLYFKEVSKYPTLNSDEEYELTSKKRDSKVINKLVQANLRFVISVAKQYQGTGVPLVDLIQYGNIGLIKAAELFDSNRGIKFISYAVWWIRQSILKGISNQCRTVRVPVNQLLCINKINKFSEKFEQENYRRPSINELEDNLDINTDKIIFVTSSANISVSLESNIDDNTCLLDIIPNNNIVSTDNEATKNDLSSEIEKILSKLPDRNSDTIRMIFGIGMSPMALEEVANKFGVGQERIRQIIRSTLKCIRSRYSKKLKDLL